MYYSHLCAYVIIITSAMCWHHGDAAACPWHCLEKINWFCQLYAVGQQIMLFLWIFKVTLSILDMFVAKFLVAWQC